MSRLTHLTDKGEARMVDISAKTPSARSATARAAIEMASETLNLILNTENPKGDVLAVARVAGIMAAKKTSDLIPLCHPIAITSVTIEFVPDQAQGILSIEATVKTAGPTGVEMEALTAVSVCALTVYDMIKAVEKGAVISSVALISKYGGKSGPYRRSAGMHAAPMAVANRKAPPRPMAPQILMHEAVSPQRETKAEKRREALRAFMAERRLKANQWAKDAGIPAAMLYSFLHGRLNKLSTEHEERLASAARASVKELFGA